MKKLIHSGLTLTVALICSLQLGYSQCGFTVSDYTPCGLTIVNFSVNNPGLGYSWDMDGDGQTDAAGSSAFYIYPFSAIPVSYTVTLYENGIACANETVIVQPPPDPSIGVIPGNGILTGNQIRVCSALPVATLSIYNASTTIASNESYSINWGDGTTDNYLAADFLATDVINHVYNGFGYYTITISVTSNSGCQALKSYLFYNGSNPSVGMANPGNTVGLCTPATITFPITNTENNPTGTVYNVYISGVLVATYTQENIPAAYTHTFLESSCGKSTTTGNYENAYDIQIVATNPCGSSQATIEPIELSSKPEPEIDTDDPDVICVQDAITLTNGSTGIGEVISGSPSTCSTNLSASWTITPGVPGVHWNILSGNLFDAGEIEIEFLIPGDYTVEMTINSQACGAFTAGQVIRVIEEPISGATVALVNASAPATSDECAPTVAIFTNASVGDSLEYEWVINPEDGWQFWNNTDDTTDNLELLFLEPGTYLVGLKATNECTTDWWDTTLVIASIPVLNFDPIPDFCETADLSFDNSNVSLYANGGSFSSFNWSFPGATPSSSTDQYPSNIQYNSPGEYVVTLNAVNQCGSTTIRDTFVIVQPGTLLLDNDYVICANEPGFNISASPGGGTWSGTGVADNGWYTPSGDYLGTHTLIYRFSEGGCDLQDSMQVTILPAPEVNAGPDQSACANDQMVVLTGASPAGGVWTVDNNGVLSGSNFDVQASGPGLYTLTYSYNNANNCSASASKTILIQDLPVVDAGPNQSFCNGPGDIVLTGFSPAGGNWTGPGVSPNGVFNAANSPGLGTYQLYYSYTDPTSNCTNLDSLTVAVIETDNVEAGPDLSFCIDADPVDLALAATPLGGTWSANGSDGLVGSTFNPATAGVGTHVISYSVGQGTCEATDLLRIEVFALPNINVLQDQEVCINEDDIILTATPVGGTWIANNGGQINGNEFSPNNSGPGNYNFTYTYTNANGCEASAEVNIAVNDIPPLMTTDTTFCNGPGNVELTGYSPTGGIWTGTGVNSSGIFNANNTPGVGSYQLYYSYTDPTNFCTNTDSMTLTLVESATADAGPDLHLCIDANSIDLSNTASPGGGVWSANGSDGLFGSIFNPSVAGVGTHLLSYTIGEGTCSATDLIEIEVYALPNVNVGQDIDICVDTEDISLLASPIGGAWVANNGGQLDGSQFSPSQSGPGNYNFTYTYINANGCEASAEMNIVVNALPILTTNDTTYCNTPGLVTLPFTSPSGGSWTGNGVINNSFNPQLAGGPGFYTLIYEYTDPNGCTNSIESNIQVVMPNPLDAGNNQNLCIDEGTIDLSQNAYPAGGNWYTTSSGGLSGSIFDPAEAGEGNHLMIYSQGTGNCEVRDSLYVTVHPLPQVFAGIDIEACFGESSFLLKGNSPPGGVWSGIGLVDPEDGIFDPSSVNPGDYTLTYSYTNAFGCYEQDTRVVTVFPMEEPEFDLPDLACRNEPVQFTNNSPAGYSSHWDFGDNHNSNSFDPVHSFTNPGVYNILLTVENEFGCTDTISHPITITDLPSAYFAPDTAEACSGIYVHLNNTSDGEGLEYLWDFGNGQTSTAERPDIFYLDPGINDTTYVISLTVTNICGTSFYQELITVHPDPKATFGMAPQTDCSPLIIDFANSSTGSITSYFWDFGNGQTSTDPFPEPQTYTTDTTTTIYTAMLIATNVCGSDTIYKDIVVEPAQVQAFFEVSDDDGCAPHEVNFSNFSTNGAIIEWDFGDGNSSTQSEPNHIFEEPGVYTVIQYAHSECGYDTATVQIEVIPPPAVLFNHAPFVCVGQEISFENLSVNISGNNWDFGDGNTSYLTSPTHIFDSVGTYTVTLTGLSSVNQCPAVYTSEILVKGLPEAQFDTPVTYGCAPLSIQFDNQSEGIEFFEWDFGDGNTSIEENPSHVYLDSGTYEIKLTVTDANGCFNDTSILNLLVNPVPVAKFAYEKEQLCGLPADIYFENQSVGASGFEWFFGDSIQSIFNDPTHTYETSGDYDVQMIAVNEYGCRDTTEDAFTIFPQPTAEFSLVDQEGCTPVEVEFGNQSTAANHYFWDFGDGNYSEEANPMHVYDEVGTYDVSLIVGVDETCFDTVELNSLIQVFPTPIANFEMEEILENGQKTGQYDITNHSENAEFYFWDFGDGNTSEEENPSHRYFTNAVKQVYLEASNDYGCVADTLINLYPNFIKGLFIPNGFSPEQGIGDVRLFKPKGVGLKEYHIRVFSTYGQLLWESKELDNGQPAEAWDGVYQGKLLPQDVYVWKASAIFEDGTVWRGQQNEKGKYQVMGSVILLR